MNPIYSIIVPVYNAEKYLESSIRSVLDQNSDSAFEIILVNDGSRDGSAAICDRFALQDARIRVIHQENQGVSAARNAGIGAAKGQYVLFLDSDDLWDPKLLESVDRLIPRQADMIEFGNCHFSDSGVQKTEIPACCASGESGMQHFETLGDNGIMPIVTCWAAAFRRQFLLDHQLRFPVGVSYGEDFFFCMHCLKQAQSVYTIGEALYWYRANELSVTRNPNLKKARDLLTVTVEIYRLLPSSLLADYYCMRIWCIEDLKREDAQQLFGLLHENRDILRHIRGWQARLARTLYGIFGWYNGAKLLRVLSNIRHFGRN